MKYIYPAVFTKDGDFYIVKFPDIEGCYTQGETLSEAVEMAEDALCLMLYEYEEEGKKIPEPSDIKKIKVS